MPPSINSICVYCGANPGQDAAYADAANQLGQLLADRSIELVYGGGNVGLMGTIADAVMAGGGRVTGIIPKAIADVEVAHRAVTELHIVGNMHERKSMMARRADAFIVLPGGIGTMEEMFEAWTWAQLGIHHKPIGLLNTHGYYDALLKFLDAMSGEGFLKPAHRSMLLTGTTPESVLQTLLEAEPEKDAAWEGKWTQI